MVKKLIFDRSDLLILQHIKYLIGLNVQGRSSSIGNNICKELFVLCNNLYSKIYDMKFLAVKIMTSNYCFSKEGRG